MHPSPSARQFRLLLNDLATSALRRIFLQLTPPKGQRWRCRIGGGRSAACRIGDGRGDFAIAAPSKRPMILDEQKVRRACKIVCNLRRPNETPKLRPSIQTRDLIPVPRCVKLWRRITSARAYCHKRWAAVAAGGASVSGAERGEFDRKGSVVPCRSRLHHPHVRVWVSNKDSGRKH